MSGLRRTTLRAACGFVVAGTIVASCSGGGIRTGGNVLPVAFNARPNTLHAIPFAVTNGNNVTLFFPGQSVPVTISQGVGNPKAAAFDPAGNLYVLNAASAQHSRGSVTVYASGTQVRTISRGIDDPAALALDRFGHLYVANQPASKLAPASCRHGCVTVYQPGGTSLLHAITRGVTSPAALTVDSRGDLYVANSPLEGTSSIAVYARGTTKPWYTITSGVANPRALAVDAADNLYVANKSAVTVYAFRHATPSNAIVREISAPSALALSPTGKLYVANFDANDVTIYAGKGSKYAGSIRSGVKYPTGVAFDALGKLYVTNQYGATGAGTVTVYAPGGAYVRTLTAGVSFPTTLAFAKGKIPVVAPSAPPSSSPTPPATPLPRGSWTAGPSMPYALHELAAAGDPNDSTLYVVGGDNGGYGNELLALQPASSSGWTQKASLPTRGRCCLAASIVGTTLYALGGDLGGDTPTGELDAYNPSTNAWQVEARMPTPRVYLASAAINGILYAVGGRSETAPSVAYNTVEAYNPSTGTWTEEAPMPTGRFALGLGVINGILYAAGGISNAGNSLTKLEAYDPSTNAWTTKAPMPTVRDQFVTGVVNGILYVISGDDGTPAYDATVDAYNPATNSWTTGLAPIPTARNVFAGGVVNNAIYAAGGNSNGSILSSVDVFSPLATSSPSPPTPTPSPSSGYKIVYGFAGGSGDGANPQGTLIAANGALYGTTFGGGRYGACPGGCGTIFRVTPAGNEALLHSFGSKGDGSLPQAGLTFAGGVLYGTTTQGGAYAPPFCALKCTDLGGIVFSIGKAGENYRIVHSFGKGADGWEPQAPLLPIDGTLYGTTNNGPGSLTCSAGGCGTIYSLTPGGNESVIFGFDNSTRNGAGPETSGVIDVGGALYGVTNFGGRYDPGNGWANHTYGTIYRVTASGKETVLHDFGKGSDGSGPSGSLIAVGDTLYGVTNQGGAYGRFGGARARGTAFRIKSDGTGYRKLHDFGSGTDGTGPNGPLVDVNGTLYGTTDAGGTYGCGTIYSIDIATNAERVLYNFCSNASDGFVPYVGLTNLDGKLYGVTNSGGAQSHGTVFAFTLK